MKRIWMTGICALCLAVLVCAGALADTVTMNGTVKAGETVQVYAPIGGTVDTVRAEAGQEIGADDVLFVLRTNKVYAEEDGTVTGVFGQPGDTASTVAGRYGAVLYIEGPTAFSVSASTDNAYNAAATKFVHVGETVYLQCRSNAERKGTGTITAVEGTGYTVKVTEGTFIAGDSVEIYRDQAQTNTQKVGRGTVSRVAPTAVSGSGAIVRIAVKNGDRVKRGDLLMETLDGSFDGLYMSGTEVTAGQSGVLGSLNASQGAAIQKNSVVAVIYPLSGMRVEASVPEDSRSSVHEGDRVLIELEADETKTYIGTVTMVSSVAETGGGEAAYRVLISFEPDDDVRFGMNVVVTAGDDAVWMIAEKEANNGTENTADIPEAE